MTKLWIMGAILILMGCSSPSFQAELAFDAACWPIADTLSVDYAQAADSLEVGLSLRFEEAYGYRNFYWKVLLHTSEGTLIDTLFNEVFIDPEGNWQLPRDIQGKYGAIFSRKIPLAEAITPARVQVLPYMRDTNLCGITHAGLMLDPK